MALLVAPIVEGHAEVEAVPILVRRIQQTFRPQSYIEVLRPIRQPKNQLVTRAGLFDISYVLAAREFESWFAAAAVPLQGEVTPPLEPESLGKGWVKRHFPSYSEMIDQPRFTARMDFARVPRPVALLRQAM